MQPRVAKGPGSGVTSRSRCTRGSTVHATLPKTSPHPQPEQPEGAGGCPAWGDRGAGAAPEPPGERMG